MDEALVKNSEHNINSNERRQYEQCLVCPDGFIGLGSALEASLYTGGHFEPALNSFHRGYGLAQGNTRRQIKGDCDNRELSLVCDGQRAGLLFKVSDRCKRYR